MSIHILCLSVWKNQEFGKDLFPTCLNILIINILLSDTKALSCIKEIHTLTIGNYVLELPPKRKIFIMNGMTQTGWLSEKITIPSRRHGVYMKCIWEAG